MENEAKIFKAMSEAPRLRLLALLVHGELRVVDMVSITRMPQSTVSRHLAYLKNKELVIMRTDGIQSFYGVNRHNDTLIKTLLGCVTNCLSRNPTAMADTAALRELILKNSKNASGAVRVLFVCMHNSARSLIAEVYARKLGGNRIIAESAGLEPGSMNPLVAQVLKEKGFYLTGCRSKSVTDLLRAGRVYDYIITVCSETEGAACPVFPCKAKRLHWEFDDPAKLKGSKKIKLRYLRVIRDEIGQKVKKLIDAILKQ